MLPVVDLLEHGVAPRYYTVAAVRWTLVSSVCSSSREIFSVLADTSPKLKQTNKQISIMVGNPGPVVGSSVYPCAS